MPENFHMPKRISGVQRAYRGNRCQGFDETKMLYLYTLWILSPLLHLQIKDATVSCVRFSRQSKSCFGRLDAVLRHVSHAGVHQGEGIICKKQELQGIQGKRWAKEAIIRRNFQGIFPLALQPAVSASIAKVDTAFRDELPRTITMRGAVTSG